jgi:hypothetical protein
VEASKALGVYRPKDNGRDIRTGSKRLIVTIPPRHGKSLFISQYFPAWFVGMYPGKGVMLASYEADFAAGWGRSARGILEEWGHLIRVCK